MADSGYMEQQGYMTPFRDTRYHKTHFRGVDVRTLDRQEKFNYIYSKLSNVIERKFGHLKERWHILEGVPFFRREKQAWVIISCFAIDNYLWLCKYGDGSTYDPSDWVAMNSTINISVLRELVSIGVGIYCCVAFIMSINSFLVCKFETICNVMNYYYIK